MFEFENAVAIKICGVTNAEDALACAAAGVEMIGLNFAAESPRRIALMTAGEIIAAVRPEFPWVKFVGVFVNQELSFVRGTLQELALDAVQLHGDETPEYLSALQAPFVIKALRIGYGSVPSNAPDYPADAILLDTWSVKARGGTGEVFPWSLAAALRPDVKRIILAGGLTSENVAEAVRTVQPFAVDVCSGVETPPERKDHGKVRRFVAAVRGASRESSTK